MIQNIITSILAFVSTNIDDIFILTLFYGTKKYKSAEIITGQYFGITALVVISLIGSLIGNFIDHRYIGFLGLFPIYLAIRQILGLMKGEGDQANQTGLVNKHFGIFAIAGVTIANGGDNIGVYIPLLTTLTGQEKIQFVIVFLVMVYLWCLAARYLAYHPLLATSLNKFGHVIMPIVLFLLGTFIIYDSESLSLLWPR
jgi:cadmium resistance protein CadD (predicted permease)